MITESCWNGAASGRFSGVGRSVPYAMGVFGNQRELAGNDAFPCGAGRSPPPTRESKVSATTRASGAQRSVCASGRKGWAGNGAEIIPKVSINFGQSLSHGCAVPAPVVVPKILCSLNAHRILTTATPFCSLLPPLAALANVPLYTREPLGRGIRIAASLRSSQ